jgi:hypothetical protein
MRRKKESELEKLEAWDSNKAEIRKPQKPSRVVFSVAFKRDDFDRVSKYAELCGKKTSEFIRDAAIEKTLMQENFTSFLFGSGSLGTVWSIDQMTPITMVSGLPVEHPEDIIALTS